MRYFTLGKGTISLDFIAAILSLALVRRFKDEVQQGGRMGRKV